MPKKALVAFGVVLGFELLVFSVPAWRSVAEAVEQASSGPPRTAPITIEEHFSQSTARLPVLTLADALTRVLQQSPKLAVFSLEVRARESEAHQAGLRPNPELSVEVENVAGSGELSGTDSAETTIRVSQLVELGGKRAKRQEVGRLHQERSELEYAIARAEVLAETRDRFAAVLAAQERISLAEEQVILARKVLQAVEDRIAAGKTAVVEGVRFKTLLAEANLRREMGRQELDAARRVLATSWGSEEIDFATVGGSLAPVPGVPDWTELVSRLDQSPMIDLRRSASRSARGTLALERAKRIPDLTLSLGARNDQDSGENAWVAGASIPLPVFDRNQGMVAAARAREAGAREAERTTQLQLRTELAAAWLKLQAARSEVAALQAEILPAVEKSFEAVVYGYQAGKFDLLEVLDAERTLFEAKSRNVEALTACHQAIAELERLLGQEIFQQGGFYAPGASERGQL